MSEAVQSRCRLAANLIIFCNLLYWLGRSCIRPAFPMLLHDELSADSLGLLLSLQSFLPIFFSLSAGSLGDRFGHVRVLNAGGICSAFSVLCFLYGFLDTTPGNQKMPVWVFGMVLSGMAWLFFWLALQSLAATPLRGGGEGKVPSVSQMIYRLSLTMSMGLIIGPVLTGFMLEWGTPEAFWLTQLVLSIGHALVCWVLARMMRGAVFAEEEKTLAGQGKRRSAWTLGFPEFLENWSSFGGRPYVSVLLVSLLMLFSVDLMGTFVPAHLGNAGVSESEIGIIIIGGHLAGVLLRIALAFRWFSLSERVGLAASVCLCALGLFFMALLPPNFSWLAIGVFLGMGIGLGEPVGMQIIARYAAPERRGLALGGRVLVNRIGMFLAPYVGFKAFSMFGPVVGGLGLAFSVATVGAVAIYVYRSDGPQD